MPALTDIWFRTGLDLEALGQCIGLENIRYDGEDYWDWIIGDFGDLLIDVTRTHTLPPDQTDTRMFLYPGADEFAPKVAEELVARLHDSGIGAVHLGTWIHGRGNDFTKHLLETKLKTQPGE